jgi:hypothetical protein
MILHDDSEAFGSVLPAYVPVGARITPAISVPMAYNGTTTQQPVIYRFDKNTQSISYAETLCYEKVKILHRFQ